MLRSKFIACVRRWSRCLHSFSRSWPSRIGSTFHPHPLDAPTARRIAHYAGQDLYYGTVYGKQLVGYGMLRGWDEGYAVPSLGVAVHPQARGAGVGKLLMHFLHAAARCRGATQVRLKVHRENEVALAMYQRLGYVFEAEAAPDGQVVGMIAL